MAGEVLQLDDALTNGRQYTFVFHDDNTFISPDVGGLLNDLYANAPDFLTSVSVVKNAPFYNVIFNYEGDGSDIVTDLASAMVAAFLAGSNDKLSFVQAVNGGTTNTPPSTSISWSCKLNPLSWLGAPTSACQVEANQAQIQSVVNNAKAAGYTPSTVATIQATATAQEAQVPKDVATTNPPCTWSIFGCCADSGFMDCLLGKANTTVYLLLALIVAYLIFYFRRPLKAATSAGA